jgi:hypothetical protein
LKKEGITACGALIGLEVGAGFSEEEEEVEEEELELQEDEEEEVNNEDDEDVGLDGVFVVMGGGFRRTPP